MVSGGIPASRALLLEWRSVDDLNNVFSKYELDARIQELQEAEKPISRSEDEKYFARMELN